MLQDYETGMLSMGGPKYYERKEMNSLSPFERRLAQNEVIYHEGEESNEMYFVRKGKVKIVASSWGSQTILTVVEEGGFFGETALIDDTPRINSAVALEETELLVIDRESFQANLASNPVLKHILETLIQRIKDITALVCEKDVVKKYERFSRIQHSLLSSKGCT